MSERESRRRFLGDVARWASMLALGGLVGRAVLDSGRRVAGSSTSQGAVLCRRCGRFSTCRLERGRKARLMLKPGERREISPTARVGLCGSVDQPDRRKEARP